MHTHRRTHSSATGYRRATPCATSLVCRVVDAATNHVDDCRAGANDAPSNDHAGGCRCTSNDQAGGYRSANNGHGAVIHRARRPVARAGGDRARVARANRDRASTGFHASPPRGNAGGCAVRAAARRAVHAPRSAGAWGGRRRLIAPGASVLFFVALYRKTARVGRSLSLDLFVRHALSFPQHPTKAIPAREHLPYDQTGGGASTYIFFEFAGKPNEGETRP